MVKKSVYTPAETTICLPGLKPVLEMLRSDASPIERVYVKTALSQGLLQEISTLCVQKKIPLHEVSEQKLGLLCSPQAGHAVHHQGILAVLRPVNITPLEQLLNQATLAPLPLILALDQVKDPGNVGSLARTLHAMGGAGIIMPAHNSAPIGPGAQKSAAGALVRLPIARISNLARALDVAEEKNFSIYGTGSPQQVAGIPVFNALTYRITLPAVLVLGSEDRGMRPGVAKRCGSLLHIPMANNFDSLNVAQAGAILIGLAARDTANEGIPSGQ